MKNTISPSAGEPTHNEDAVGTRSRSKRSLKAVAAVAATAIAVGSVGLTAANWSDSEAVGSELSSGHFDMEISVDDGATWHTQTVENGALDLSMSSIFEDSEPWGPGETRTSEVLLRLSDDTTHNGTFILDEMISVEGSGDVDDYSWEISDTSPSTRRSFCDASGESNFPLFSGDSLSEAESLIEDDPYFYPISQRPLSFSHSSLRSLPMNSPALGDFESARSMELCFKVSSNADLQELSSAEAEWTLNVEQSTYRDIARTVLLDELESGRDIVEEHLAESPRGWATLTSSAYTTLVSADETKRWLEDTGLLELFPEEYVREHLPDGIEWTVDGMLDISEIATEDQDHGFTLEELIVYTYAEMLAATELYPEEAERFYGSTSAEEIMGLMMGDELFERAVERYDITIPLDWRSVLGL